MNNTKTNPIGLDAKLQSIQKRLYDELNTAWSIVLDAYGRCYVIQDNGVNTVQYFKSKQEYEIISVAEKNKLFFLNRSIEKKIDTLTYETNIELIFIVNLSQLKPSISHRADKEAQADVEFILNQFEGVWVESLEQGYDNVLKGIKYDQSSDMQPYHCFKFNLRVNYSLTDECNCGC
jgi:hypothetical protein